jgi:hypothetical protein
MIGDHVISMPHEQPLRRPGVPLHAISGGADIRHALAASVEVVARTAKCRSSTFVYRGEDERQRSGEACLTRLDRLFGTE